MLIIYFTHFFLPVRMGTMQSCVRAYRDATPLAPHTGEDVGGAAGTPAHLAACSGRCVPLPPVVMEHVLAWGQRSAD